MQEKRHPQEDQFADAEATFRNADRHFETFKRSRDQWFKIHLSQSDTSTGRTAHLVIDQNAVSDRKAIIFDISVNLVHTLDLLIAACARLQGANRLTDLKFPIDERDQEFEKKVSDLVKGNIISMAHGSAIMDSRSGDLSGHRSTNTLKEVANSCKHWKLIATSERVLGISVLEGAKLHAMIDVDFSCMESTGYVSFPWPQNAGPDAVISTLTGQKIEVNVRTEMRVTTPTLLFESAQRYVRATIDALREAK